MNKNDLNNNFKIDIDLLNDILTSARKVLLKEIQEERIGSDEYNFSTSIIIALRNYLQKKPLNSFNEENK